MFIHLLLQILKYTFKFEFIFYYSHNNNKFVHTNLDADCLCDNH